MLVASSWGQVDCFFLTESFTGVCETLYPDGKLKIKAELKDGQRHGMMTLKYPDGTTRADGFFQNDSLIYTISYQYYPGRKIKWEMKTEKGLTHAKMFDEAGNMVQSCTYDIDLKPHGEWIRYEAGFEAERVLMQEATEEVKARFYPPGRPARMPQLRVATPK